MQIKGHLLLLILDFKKANRAIDKVNLYLS